MKGTRSVRAALAFLLATLVMTPAPGQADPPDPSEADESDELRTAYTLKTDATSNDLQEAIEEEEEVLEVAHLVRDFFDATNPDGLGGMYISHVDGRSLLHIGLVDPSDQQAVETITDKLPSGSVNFFEAPNTLPDLNALHDQIADDYDELKTLGIDTTIIWTDEQLNRVMVGVSTLTPVIEATLNIRYGDDRIDVKQESPWHVRTAN